MYNNYLDDIVSINSEFIYESILIESNIFTNITEKIKILWEKFKNFLRKIKNNILAFIKKEKKTILDSKDIKIEIKDFSNIIKIFKNIVSDIDNGSYKLDNLNEVLKHIPSDININEKQTYEIPNAIKTLEYQLNQVEKITERFEKLINERFINKIEHLIKNDNIERDELMKLQKTGNEVNDVSNKVIKVLSELLNKIKQEIEICTKKTNNKDSENTNIDTKIIKEIDTSVDKARNLILSKIQNTWLWYYNKNESKELKSYLEYAEKKYGDTLYEEDKQMKDEEKWLYNLALEKIKKKDLTKSEFEELVSELNSHISMGINFSKKKIHFLVNEIYKISMSNIITK